MVFYGIIYGLLENDIRRILSYSLVNQVGFMVTAIGIGTPMALNGAAAHAFTHIIYKALLLMSAGSVMTMTGRSKCSELGGLSRTMPVTAIAGIIGGLSISAVPLTSGFVSKAMIAEGAAAAHMPIVWLLVTAGAVGVFIDIGLKWPWFIFFAGTRGSRARRPAARHARRHDPVCAACASSWASFPGTLYALLPFPVDYVPYTVPHVATTLQLLLAGGLAFVLVLPLLKRTDDHHPRHRLVLARSRAAALARAFDGRSSPRPAELRRSRRAQRRPSAADDLPPPRSGRHPGQNLADRQHGVLGDAVACGLSGSVLL